MNDMPTFAALENGVVDGAMYTQTVSVPVSNSETKIMDQTSIENIAMPLPTTTNSGTLQPNLMASYSHSSGSIPVSTIAVPAVCTQKHASSSSTAHQTPKPINSNTISSQNQVPSINTNQILTKTRLQDLVKEIDPCEQLDEEVEDLLLQLVDDFVNSTVNTACVFAKHRNANTVEVKDVQLYLEKMYQMWVPGFGSEEVKPYKKPPVTEAHKQRLALIRKSLKKY